METPVLSRRKRLDKVLCQITDVRPAGGPLLDFMIFLLCSVLTRGRRALCTQMDNFLLFAHYYNYLVKTKRTTVFCSATIELSFIVQTNQSFTH